MKWTRERTGKYTAGSYTITGKGVKWTLTWDDGYSYENNLIGHFAGKKLAQEAAKKHSTQPKPEKEKAPEAPKEEGDLLATLRLDISGLHLQVIELTDAVKRLTKLLEKE